MEKLQQLLHDLSNQVTELQSQMAFQEHTIATLNDEVALLQREVEALNLRWKDTREQIAGLQTDSDSPLSEQPPPHY